MNKKLIFGLIPVVLLTLFLPGVLSSCGYLSTFEQTYPNAVNSSIDTCELCHISPSGAGSLNSYGTDFGNNGHNFITIEPKDSDGDGFTNIAEINATTFPGKALDNLLTPKKTLALDGATFYSTYCSSCHNPLASSSKMGSTAAQIQIAINTVPEMKSISSLRMVQLQAISTALAVSTSSSPTTAFERSALYASYCQGCHNPLSSSTKKGRTADQIKNSISSVSAMNSLSSLNSVQIQAIATALGASSTSLPTLTLDGATLYASNCAGCHRSLGSTDKPGRTVAQIQNAINAVSAMNSLSSMSPEQIQAIAALLPAAITTPTPTPIPTPLITTTLDGATLYADFCTSCHSPLDSTTKPGRTAQQITSAISAISSMNSLSTLSPEQITAIATVLPPIPTPTPTPPPTTTLDGATLYANYCASCHSSLASTTKPGRTAAQISGAISSVSVMNTATLRSLSSAQITAIASVLSPAPTPTPAPTLDGATLYATYCSSCHSSLASTTKPGRTATQITSAISSVSVMNTATLRSLSSAQITAIASVLPPAPTPTPAPTLDGATLYATYCSSCHNSLASTTKPGRTAAQISGAISSVSVMNTATLRSLSSAQITAIASVLPPAPTPTPTPAPTLDGATLYATYCSSCHNSLASTTKPGRTAAQISGAISSVSVMNTATLRSLSSAQISAIASVLPPAPTPTPTPATLDGATLYATYCSSCHNSLASTTKPGRTATQISSAITSVSAMNSLSTLSSAQISAIASVLPPMPTDGAALYASYCSSCHHPLASSDVKKASARTITNRINEVSEMNSLSTLSSAQITAIANALATA